ncbi:cyclin-H1 [Salix suchowensis]|nr:cyclin-H1 [Salix suchowensis]
MASLLVSINFSMPLSAPKFSPRELQQRKSAVTRLSSQATTRTGILQPTAWSFATQLGYTFVNQSFCGYLTTPTNLYYELVSSCIHVSSCTHKTITGYWVGPNIDDGCGFVEAFVYQIS